MRLELSVGLVLAQCVDASCSGEFIGAFALDAGGRFAKAVSDFNGTRAGDVFVVNFGAHYRDGPESDAMFRSDVFPILEAMATFAEEEDVTMVWR